MVGVPDQSSNMKKAIQLKMGGFLDFLVEMRRSVHDPIPRTASPVRRFRDNIGLANETRFYFVAAALFFVNG